MKVDLPQAEYPLLIRTDFGDEQKWVEIVDKINFPSSGFDAAITIIDNVIYDGLKVEELPRFGAEQNDYDFIFLADNFSMTSTESTVCCVDLGDNFGTIFRVSSDSIGEVANTLFVGKADFSDFEQMADDNKIYRGMLW